LLLLLALAQSGAEPLTLEQAEQMALKESPDVASSAAAIEGALADQQSQRGNLLPRLHVDGQLQYWGSPYSISFLSSIPTGSLPPSIAQVFSSIPPTTVRDSTTSTLTFTLSQPLTQLWGLFRQLDSQKLAHEAAMAHLDASGRDLIFQVRQIYFRLLQAAGNAGIAQDSVEQLASHVDVAKQQFAAGTLVKADLLRAQVQLGQARQDLVKAKAAAVEAQAALDELIGLPAEGAIKPVDPFGDAIPPSPTDGIQELTDQALQSRPDLHELQLRRDQADRLVTVAWSQLVPGISAVGQYQHSTGQLFLAADQAFVGGTLSWDIWDWGNKYYEVKSARSKVEQAEQTLRSAELKLRTQVQTALQETLADRDALAVAAEVVDQAQESFRLETERYKAQTATATDLLDAQAALSQAKYRLSNARYDYLIEVAQLEDLVGRPLLGR
jgi:outer membrane protein TolC